ncbi:GntR family transcriptional regulator [Pelagibius sp. Alg239-R121]|uniref:GntR family transcriptional regulator n=1 Tax=Pelagibius sp. Alg239-R121 TaxID=2993448 RepID=UPI0024A6D417|nr:GntR family transcriptional regulator [Pelagibius sp. Alg239-R121]
MAKHIAAAIDDGTFQPGERLVETRLAEMFGVSRGPVREALKALESENIVKIKPGRGTFVAAPSCEDVEQIVAARAVLEGLAARTVVALPDKRELSRLNLLCKSMRDSVEREDISGYLELHWRVHELLCHLSRNQVLIQAWQSMRCQLRLFWRGKVTNIELIGKLSDETFVLIDSLYGDDPDLADQLFRSHIIRANYEIMGKAVPNWLQSYVTCEIETRKTIFHPRNKSSTTAVNGLKQENSGSESLPG